jgi:hypothetical protein
MRKQAGLLTAGLAVVLAAGAGTALAATAGPVDSGVIHGCWTDTAISGSHVFKLQDAGTKCPKGTTAISWGEKGPAGPRGATGPAGSPGPAGPGFDFTAASGGTGPVIPAAGTYFIDVEFDAANNTASAIVATCSVGLSLLGQVPPVAFTSAFVQAAGSPTVDESVSGILPVTSQAGLPLNIGCFDSSGSQISISDVQWYVSPVRTSP